MATRCAQVAVLVVLAALAASFGSSLAGALPSPESISHNSASAPAASPAPGVRTILVFPFENGSRDASLDWLCEGLAELTIERLQGPRRFVLAREGPARRAGADGGFRQRRI